jgi:ribulose kinase
MGMELSTITFDICELMCVVVDKVLNKLQWDHLCLVAIAFDGVSSMIGFQVGLTT